MKNYKNILVMVVLSSAFFIQAMGAEKSFANLAEEGDGETVVCCGSSSDSESDGEGLDNALLRVKSARRKATSGIPLRRLSSIGATKEPLVRRCDIPGLHSAARACGASHAGKELSVAQSSAQRLPVYQGAPVSHGRYPDQKLRDEEERLVAAAAPAPVVSEHQRPRSYAEVFDGAGLPILGSEKVVKPLSTVPEGDDSGSSDEDSLGELVARLAQQKKLTRK